MDKTTETHTLIIGAGQAGLAMGYHLRRRQIPFLLLESHSRWGESWRNRYESLVLFTSRCYMQCSSSSMVVGRCDRGLPFPFFFPRFSSSPALLPC
ncbi:NAD(P)-binding protein [Marininema mesophilum]|uniref:NAD(P)-binding protein n=1 Tax=Marininema mesophilum TaxID=1048340 RepID=UPI00115FF881